VSSPNPGKDNKIGSGKLIIIAVKNITKYCNELGVLK
jgi:hypothetical protein